MPEIKDSTWPEAVVTVVNYVRRFQPAYLRIKEEIDNGHVGEIMSIACFSDRGWGLATHGNPHPAVAHPERPGNWLVHHASPATSPVKKKTPHPVCLPSLCVSAMSMAARIRSAVKSIVMAYPPRDEPE